MVGRFKEKARRHIELDVGAEIVGQKNGYMALSGGSCVGRFRLCDDCGAQESGDLSRLRKSSGETFSL